MWGSLPGSAALNSISFVSQESIDCGTIESYGLKKRVEAVCGCREVTKESMKLNDRTPTMTVDPEKYEVRADGEVVDVQPADKLPLGRFYNFF